MWFKNIIGYLDKAIRSNTGVSSLSLIAVAIGIVSIITILVICICMLVEIFTAYTIATSLDGYAAIIGAVAGLITAAGLPKALNNFGENKYKSMGSSEEEQ